MSEGGDTCRKPLDPPSRFHSRRRLAWGAKLQTLYQPKINENHLKKLTFTAAQRPVRFLVVDFSALLRPASDRCDV